MRTGAPGIEAETVGIHHSIGIDKLCIAQPQLKNLGAVFDIFHNSYERTGWFQTKDVSTMPYHLGRVVTGFVSDRWVIADFCKRGGNQRNRAIQLRGSAVVENHRLG